MLWILSQRIQWIIEYYYFENSEGFFFLFWDRKAQIFMYSMSFCKISRVNAWTTLLKFLIYAAHISTNTFKESFYRFTDIGLLYEWDGFER